MLRPVIAQYYRRGKSLGCRNFSSSHNNNNDVAYKELAGSVLKTFFNYGVGLAFGAGSAALFVRIFVGSNSKIDEEIERDWERKKQKL